VAKFAIWRILGDDDSVGVGGSRGSGRWSSWTFDVLTTPTLPREKFGGGPEDDFGGRGETSRVRVDGSGFSVVCEMIGPAGCLSAGGP
jgi:hypothetical protein